MRAYFRPEVDPQNFGGGMQFLVFSGRINLKQVEEQRKTSEGPGACSPENL